MTHAARLAHLVGLTCLAVLLSGFIFTPPPPFVPTNTNTIYTGPGDVVASAKAWFGLRAYSTADRGNKLIHICDPANANCVDWSSSATTGKLVNQIVGSTDCTAVNTCTVQTMYDRSGSLACGSAVCDVTQATAADRSTLTWNCLNGLPCLVLNGTTVFLTNSTGFSQAQSFTISTMLNRVSGTGPGSAFANTAAGSNVFFGFRNTTANTVQIFSGTAGIVLGNITDANWHSFQVAFVGSSSFIFCGGSAGTSCSVAGTKSSSLSPGSGTISGAIALGNDTGVSGDYEVTEMGVWNGTFTGPQLTNMAANQGGFYGSF